MNACAQPGGAPSPLPRGHAARLRHYWRSQGWACHDNVDIDLLRWGLIVERPGAHVASCFTLTEAGRNALGDGLERNRRARNAHSEATEAVARHLASAGRLVFTELSVRTEHEGRWRSCKPDVFSLVRGLRADHLAPQVHEVKVRRADLLGELRGAKIERYRELAASIYLVIADGIAEPDEIPAAYGVALYAPDAGFRIARAAPIGDYTLETRHWMALAKATPFTSEPTTAQLSL
ncbi:hypothetical protein [Salinisphaera sp.]|uniref:hypothetical protein n=1 Tax=Salinisphaera sp. TaxID=1914330 RepID=UPI002D77B1E3|nr:hypothetical protein [Salinisphaera sp.]HET7315533.1 hypothetical protein [Salinisphaera sp.]